MTRAIVGRPMLESELSEALGVSRHNLKTILDRYEVRPAFLLGRRRLRCYSPSQIEHLYSLIQS